MTYQYDLDEEDELFNSMMGLLHVFCDEFADDIKNQAYQHIKAKFKSGELQSSFGKIKNFPSQRNCVINFNSYEGGFLHMNNKSGDYLYVEFSREELINFIRTAVNKG